MKTRTRAIAFLGVTWMFGPALASSEAGSFRPSGQDVVLYELNEEARFTVDNGRLHRGASSGLEGKAKVGTPLCPAALVQHAEQVFRARQRRGEDVGRWAAAAHRHT